MVAFARAFRGAKPDPFGGNDDAQPPVQMRRGPVDRKPPKDLTDEEALEQAENTPDRSEAVTHWADQGTSGAGQPLPYMAQIQQAFGPGHNVSGMRAHQGESASQAAQAMGAEAFATGNDIAFGQEPSLHTAAHEAAHVVQQRTGVHLKGGVGAADDVYEREADQVADRVVSGQSAEHLLPQPSRESTKRSADSPVQRKGAIELDAEELKAEGQDVELNKKQLAAAVAFNNKKWTGKFREQLLGFLRGTGEDEKGAFTAADVQVAAQLQQGAGAKADGMIGDGSMAILLNAGFEFSDDVMGVDKAGDAKKPKASEVTLEFWPGEMEDMGAWNTAISAAEKKSIEKGDATPYRHLNAPNGEGRIYVKVGGKVVAMYRGRGGPPRKIKDFGGHTADPTQGNYTLGGEQKGFTTKSWTNSQIPWAADVRKGKGGGYEFKKDGTDLWKADPGAIDAETYDELPDQDGDGVKDWNKNDFGASAWRVEGSPGFLVHTTPETEEASAVGDDVELTVSHGCIHIDPAERDQMVARGFLQKGVRFNCKKYTDHLLPAKAREQVMKQFE